MKLSTGVPQHKRMCCHEVVKDIKSNFRLYFGFYVSFVTSFVNRFKEIYQHTTM